MILLFFRRNLLYQSIPLFFYFFVTYVLSHYMICKAGIIKPQLGSLENDPVKCRFFLLKNSLLFNLFHNKIFVKIKTVRRNFNGFHCRYYKQHQRLYVQLYIDSSIDRRRTLFFIQDKIHTDTSAGRIYKSYR